MMHKHAVLTIEISSYWHSGSGRGSGSHLDAIVDTAQDGIPYLSGRHIKGLLRDAVNKAEIWGQLTEYQAKEPTSSITNLLFGARFTDPETRVPRDETTQGILRIGDARLPEEIHTWLAQPKQYRQFASHLHRAISSTAIDSDRGVARGRSLRGLQVTIPLQLTAQIETVAILKPNLKDDTQTTVAAAEKSITEQWPQILEHCLPLIRAVGAQRGRGLGRASLALTFGETS